MRKTFKYRIYPTHMQERLLNETLGECRWLYNQLLEQRKAAWDERQESLNLYDQHALFPAMKAARPTLKLVHSQVLQNVGVRIDLAMKAFFRRVKSGETPGYPRFRGADRYDSFTYPQAPSGCKLVGDRLHLTKIGSIRVVLHRPLEGTPKTVTVQRSSTGKWYVAFSCEWEPTPLPVLEKQVGIDVGLTFFATFSDGDAIENPRFFRKEEQALATQSRRFQKIRDAEADQRSRLYRKAKKRIARVHERVAWRRENFSHQESRKVVNASQFIAVEDLSVNRMAHNHCLAKSIHDAAWSTFTSMLSYKAECAGRTYIAVNPAYTSQDCSNCGHRQKMSLSERIYTCACCKLVLNRDHNAALNILRLGLQATGTQSREAARVIPSAE